MLARPWLSIPAKSTPRTGRIPKRDLRLSVTIAPVTPLATTKCGQSRGQRENRRLGQYLQAIGPPPQIRRNRLCRLAPVPAPQPGHNRRMCLRRKPPPCRRPSLIKWSSAGPVFNSEAPSAALADPALLRGFIDPSMTSHLGWKLRCKVRDWPTLSRSDTGGTAASRPSSDIASAAFCPILGSVRARWRSQ